MKKFTLLVLLISLLVPTISNSQFNIGKKLEQKAKDRLNRKIDKTIDKGLDKVEDGVDDGVKKSTEKSKDDKNADTETESNSDEIDFSGLFGGGSVDLPDSYTYNKSITYSIVSKNKKESNEMQIQYSFPESGNFLCTSMKEVKSNGEVIDMPGGMDMIMDFDLNKMVTVMKEQKMIMVMSMDPIEEMVEENVEEAQENQTFRKTGNTKTILGYKCDEYEYSDDEYDGIMWITQDPSLNLTQMFASFQGQQNNPFGGIEGPKSGTMMEMKMVSKKKKEEEIEMKLIDISKETNSIDLSGMQVLAMPSK